MARKNPNPQQEKNANKNVLTKKETKKTKINSKKNKKEEPSESQQNDDEQQINAQQLSSPENDSQESENQDESSGSSENEDSDDEESDEQSSQQSLAPENYAIKQIQYRQRRGTKMNYLMNLKKDEEEDPFWKNQGQEYFGDLDDQNDEDYQQSSSGRDQFDSDFDQTESEHEQEEKKVQEPEVDQQQQKQKKKQQELMRKIGAPTQKKAAPKTATSTKKQQSEKKPVVEPTNRYIHQVCTQQQLLGQAAQTQYINWLSLQKLISLQNEKKDFTHKEHFLQGPKIVFRDRIGENGKRATSYELVDVQIEKIADLTEFLNKNDEI